MKINKLVLIVSIAILSLISCSKDEEQIINVPVETSPTIVDDWSIEKYGYMDNNNVIVNEYDWSSDCSIKKDYLILNAPSSFTVNYFSSACESTFYAQENGVFAINATNDRLILSGGTDWDGDYTVLILTATELVLKRIPAQGITNKLGNVNFYKFSRKN